MLHGIAQYCTQPTTGSSEAACGASCGHPAMTSHTCYCHYPRVYMKFECVRGCTNHLFGACSCGMWWDDDIVQACGSKTFHTSFDLYYLPTANPFTTFTHHPIFFLRVCENQQQTENILLVVFWILFGLSKHVEIDKMGLTFGLFGMSPTQSAERLPLENEVVSTSTKWEYCITCQLTGGLYSGISGGKGVR